MNTIKVTKENQKAIALAVLTRRQELLHSGYEHRFGQIAATPACSIHHADVQRQLLELRAVRRRFDLVNDALAYWEARP